MSFIRRFLIHANSRSTNRSMPRYRSLSFGQLNTARTVGTRDRVDLLSFGDEGGIIFGFEPTQRVVVGKHPRERDRDEVKARIERNPGEEVAAVMIQPGVYGPGR
jgi:hypothetical protein